jgi:hypothetical protein
MNFPAQGVRSKNRFPNALKKKKHRLSITAASLNYQALISSQMGVDNVGLMIPTLPNKDETKEETSQQIEVYQDNSSSVLYDDMIQYENDGGLDPPQQSSTQNSEDPQKLHFGFLP